MKKRDCFLVMTYTLCSAKSGIQNRQNGGQNTVNLLKYISWHTENCRLVFEHFLNHSNPKIASREHHSYFFIKPVKRERNSHGLSLSNPASVCPLETGKKDIADEFPPSVQVHVNGKMVQLPNPIPTNKPGVEPKRPPKPVNITHCKLSHILPNTVGIK